MQVGKKRGLQQDLLHVSHGDDASGCSSRTGRVKSMAEGRTVLFRRPCFAHPVPCESTRKKMKSQRDQGHEYDGGALGPFSSVDGIDGRALGRSTEPEWARGSRFVCLLMARHMFAELISFPEEARAVKDLDEKESWMSGGGVVECDPSILDDYISPPRPAPAAANRGRYIV
ncbi:MAG: hypothetical protein Q9168_002038 [Polycauliona sp. 1 TL-2023]